MPTTTSRERAQRGALGCVAAATLFTACGGVASVTPAAGVNSLPPTTTITAGAGVPAPISLPSADGFSVTLTLAPATAVTGVGAVFYDGSEPPAGAPQPANGDTPLFFVGIQLASSVALSGTPAFTFNVPSSVTTQSSRRATQSVTTLRVDVYDPTNPSAGYQPGSACTQNGTTVTCPGGSSTLTLASDYEYVFALASAAAGSGGLTFVVPTAAPMACNPPTMTVLLGQSNIIDCSEPGYSGAFTATVANPSIASVQQSNNLNFDFFTVTGLVAGSTTATLQSGIGASVTVPITIVQ